KKVPMLIFSRNRAKDFVMIPYAESFYDLLDVNHHDVMRTTVTIKNIREEVQKFDVIVTTMDNIKRIPPQQMREYSELVKDWDPYADEYK
uniref:putative PDDEXK endonuclease n=1 Tax=Staphylococcus hominis TaxID=1290 RepID=UPI003FA3D7E8